MRSTAAPNEFIHVRNPSLIFHVLRLWTLVCLVGLAASLEAEQRELKVDQSDKVDAVLLLDASGSMLATDPSRLRDEGAKLFTQFLKPGDRLAIIGFSQDGQVIRELSDYSSEQEEAVTKDIAKVGNSGQYTNLLAGVKAAKELLEKSKRPGATPAIVLLSDGKMDPAPASGGSQALSDELLNTILPDLKAAGIKVHTLAFSEQADKDLLAQIAVATEGAHYFTPNADKIHQSYADLFVVVKKPQMLPLTSKGFKIDADVQEATFYVNGEEGAQVRIVTPAGKELHAQSQQAGLKWFKGQKFDVITIEKPEVGDWKVLGLPSNDGFATVLTNLKLVTDWPGSMNVGNPTLLQARLYEDAKPIVLPEMTQAIRYAFQVVPTDRVSEPVIREVLFDDGTHGDKISKDGIFSFLIGLDQPGEYRLQIVASAPTFERRQQIAFRVKPRIITLSVTSAEGAAVPAAASHESAKEHDSHGEAPNEQGAHKAEEGGHGEHEADGHTEDDAPKVPESGGADSFLVELSEEAAGLKDIEIKVTAVDKNGKRFVIPLIAAGEGTYRARAAHLPHDGDFQVQATLSAEGKKKNHVREVSNAISYTKVTGSGEEIVLVEEVKVVAEPAASPIIPLLLLTLINAGAAFAGHTLIKRAQSEVSFKVPEFESLEDVNKALAELEAAAALTQIDVNDPRLSEEKLGNIVLRSSSGVAPVTAAAVPAPEPANEPIPEATESEPAPEAQEAPTEAAPEEEPKEAGDS